ncbi:MFS transporter [Bradyrhizobium jicamae]|uniref:MFS transporter n=1 Tax=Bradyrhizobium jicamae TaxID=280332 RepID=A0ABS5FN16_9BRAD|nr:MFS transporter [Bradyrhizobium jicamae]MBR0798167.1 MFS transporter [Bradyrhizobium jicamae]
MRQFFTGIETGGAWAAISSGLIFMARGALLPYFFVVFHDIGNFTYGKIALLLNVFVIAQSACAVLAGGAVERSTARTASLVLLAIYLGVFACFYLARSPMALSIALAALGAAFAAARVLFNRRIIATQDRTGMRQTISLRAVLMTSGSLCGNLAAAYILSALGWKSFIAFLFCLFAASVVLFGVGTRKKPDEATNQSAPGGSIIEALGNGDFYHDILRLVPPLILYGNWGTIIPKYISDSVNDIHIIACLYTATAISALFLTFGFNGYLFKRFDQTFLKIDRYPGLATTFFTLGLLLMTLTETWTLIVIGGVVFIVGEIIIVPYLDEISRKHGGASAGSYIGLVMAAEGAMRSIGMVIGTLSYGYLSDNGARSWSFVAVIAVALGLATLIHFIGIAGKRRKSAIDTEFG